MSLAADNEDQIKDHMDLLELAIKRMDDKLKSLDGQQVRFIRWKIITYIFCYVVIVFRQAVDALGNLSSSKQS